MKNATRAQHIRDEYIFLIKKMISTIEEETQVQYDVAYIEKIISILNTVSNSKLKNYSEKFFEYAKEVNDGDSGHTVLHYIFDKILKETK